jgi:two-component system response regulator PilR (NtrC family)
MTPILSRPLHLLVVEDEALLRWAIVETLTGAGHSVEQAGDGAAARRAITEATSPIDAVLLDFRLPDSSDLSLLADIRRLSPATAVVMMTAHGTPETLAGARALGVYDILAKPFDVHGVDRILREAHRASRAT